jgi:L-aspartate oxidase
MIPQTPRYLVPFHPKQVPHYFTDVLIIGGGLAGMRAADAVKPPLSAVIVTKDVVRQSSSSYAQGGIAGVLDPEDRFEDHIADTLAAGAGLCEERVVEMVVRDAPQRIRELIEWGTHFDEEAGELLLGREGGHSRRRIVHALGDATGKEVMRAVIEHTQSRPNVQIWENTFTIDLLTHEGACRGALVWNARHGKTLVWAKQTILCTGGAGQIYRETTNPAGGHRRRPRHRLPRRRRSCATWSSCSSIPRCSTSPAAARSLITEAMRGEGAHLVDHNGRRFMPEYDERAELAPRDVVSQAIVAQMEKTRWPCVYLDLSHLDPAYVRQRFPGIAETCAQVRDRHRRPHSGSARRPLHDRRRDRRRGRPHHAPRVVGRGRSHLERPARGEPPRLEQPCWRAWSTAARPERRRRRARQNPARMISSVPLENALLPEPAEPLDLTDIRNSLTSAHVAGRGCAAPRRASDRRGRPDRHLAALRLDAAVLRPRRLGAAKHAAGGADDHRRRPGPRGIARRPSANRLPRSRR